MGNKLSRKIVETEKIPLFPDVKTRRNKYFFYENGTWYPELDTIAKELDIETTVDFWIFWIDYYKCSSKLHREIFVQSEPLYDHYHESFKRILMRADELRIELIDSCNNNGN